MRKIQTLGIILAVVMLCGLIPLGFSEPLKEQLEKGIKDENIQCDNSSHLLVQRPNGKLACVSELTAEKMEWEIINSSTQKIIYNYPLSSKAPLTDGGKNISSSSMFWGGDIEIIISKLPKVGETADVTIIFTNLATHDTIDWFEKGFGITKNLEFVDLTSEANDHIYYIDEPLKILKQNETDIVNFTIKAVAEGEAIISAVAMMENDAAIYMVIGEEETLLLKDYRERHPPAQALPPFDLGPGEIWDPYGVVRETYNPLDDSHDSFAELSRSELREELMEMGFEGEELEEIFKELWAESHPNLNTQSFLDSIIPKAYASSPQLLL